MADTFPSFLTKISGQELESLAQKWGSPLFVYNFDDFTHQFNSLKAAMGDLDPLIAFAVKANSNLSVLKHFGSLGAGFDIVSSGELFRVLEATGDASKVVFSGVGKTEDDIRYALESGVKWIAAESVAEITAIEKVAEKIRVKARVAIRVNPNVDPKTHPYISTGLKKSKFGIVENQAFDVICGLKNSEWIDFKAISFHIGSQITDISPFKMLCEFAKEFTEKLDEHGMRPESIDIGGGIGIVYKDEVPIPMKEYGKVVQDILGPLGVEVVLEPGRVLVGSGGVLLSKVLFHKEAEAGMFIMVDAAMTELMRPSLYDAYHHITPLQKKQREEKVISWVGPVCESADFIAKDRMSPVVEPGEYIAIESAGAYCFVMASNYNTRPKPAEVAWADGKAKLIRERETFATLLEKEKSCLSV